MSRLWGGRFEEKTHEEVDEFSRSLHYDQRLWRHDITGSIAHARMLGKAGVLPETESATLIAALESLREEIGAGKAAFDPKGEDIHSEIERLLRDKVGPLAGKLHTARSRNDQVATDLRLYLRDEIEALRAEIRALQKWVIATANDHFETVLPGYTHLQHGQPVSLAHHLLAYFWMLERDHGRLGDALKRVNQLPLGSAALAGTSFPLIREMVAEELCFTAICENSLDAVSDRDFVVEALAAASLLMTHLSRWCEEIILWSCQEFAFISLSDKVTTGSSLMPQKKNPDVAELIRGRAGRVFGDLMSALTMLKGLPLSYNRDLQEDKEVLFHGFDTARASVRLMLLMMTESRFNKERMRQALHGDFSNATDVADYLVRKNVPFREAHEVAGKVVLHCQKSKTALEDIDLPSLKAIHPAFEGDALPLLQPEAVMRARISRGGTGPEAVRAQLKRAQAALES